MTIVFRNARVFDGIGRDLRDGLSVVVRDGLIVEVSESPAVPADAHGVDCRGRTLLPGLIDAHVHIIATSVDLSAGKQWPSYVHAQARHIMEGMLERGFTTVRDGGGADAGFVRAVEEGYIRGPRLNISGLALSQTGGHGDMRSTLKRPQEVSNDRIGSAIARIADGVSEVREATRDELRKGAHFIKIMASGGAASVTDPIENTQYSDEELRAIVQEAEAWNTYVMAHAYTPRSIRAVVSAGGRTIEHGNLIDAESARFMHEQGAYLVPTLVASDILTQFADKYGFSAQSMRKIAQVRDRGLEGLSVAREAGVKIGFGTDLLGLELHSYQCEEFTLRATVEDPVDTLISATSVNAEMMMMGDRIGVIAPGYCADILVVQGDPTADATVFTHQGRNIDVIMKEGAFVKNRLS
ncbi:amidohydrolase family protein [Methylobacterium terricola]|uniref:Amidohydrolase family protein n=1 Tax=Methylobacterium terricola TaxID=2583531 RepID=A0A5C4L5L5_9HYPH|nr:amidohydrolase family protein [Methylobacterium terricola]TNC06701.1 amidohydrolase family protein [Methylobacterium terricola]